MGGGGGGGHLCSIGAPYRYCKRNLQLYDFPGVCPQSPSLDPRMDYFENSYLGQLVPSFFFIPYFRKITILPLMSLVATNQQFGSSEDSDQPGCPPRLTIKSSLSARRKLQSFANQTCALKAPKNGWMPSYSPTFLNQNVQKIQRSVMNGSGNFVRGG